MTTQEIITGRISMREDAANLVEKLAGAQPCDSKKENRVEIQTNEGILVLLPRAANTAEAEVRYRDAVSTQKEPS